MKAILALLALAGPCAWAEDSARAPYYPNPHELKGSYVLTRDDRGICPRSIRVWASRGLSGRSLEIWVGDYFFPRINEGTIRFDNELERGTRRTTYQNGTLRFVRTAYHKVKGQREYQRTEALFRGDTLRLLSRLDADPPAYRDCTYRRRAK